MTSSKFAAVLILAFALSLANGQSCIDESIRLVGGASSTQGRVEVCNNGAWGTVCDDSFTDVDAQVACRQLGFSSTGATAQCCAAYGQGSGAIVLDNVACIGTETSIFNCPHNGLNSHNCVHSEDVGVTCASTTCEQNSARLVGGSTIFEGRVEVCNNGEWGTVCDDGWDVNDATVVCIQLGYGSALSAPQQAAFGQGTGDIVLDDLGCVGTEPNLFSCPHSGVDVHNCGHQEDASAVCSGITPICTDGSIRLVGGASSTQGRVEVCNNGDWGTVCDDSFTDVDAQVACRQLGFSSTGATAQCCAAYGQGSGAIVLDNVACVGTETSIFNCPHNGLNSHNCGHSEDVGVTCASTTCEQNSARLVGGSTIFEGRVEVCNNGEWGTVCDDGWDVNDATVVCIQLGYGSALSAPQQAAFGQGTGDIVLDDLGCVGTEPNLFSCPHSGVNVHNCGHQEDASAVCSGIAPICTDGSIRLVEGASSTQGRVEVCNNGDWGTVCDDSFTDVDAQVACRQLGFSSTGATAQCCAAYGQGSGAIVLDNVACVGTETSIFNCPHNGLNSHNCGHSEDVGVTCASTTCEQNSARLVGGSTIFEGRVEVCNNGEWGTVCDDGWDVNDATVVCIQLGYGSALSAPQQAAFGQGTGDIVLDDLGCVGTEPNLFSCPHSGVDVHNCGHQEDASAVCSGIAPICTDGSIRLVEGASSTQGRVEVCNNGDWGTVCDDSFTDVDAQVACRQLGFSSTGATAQCCAAYGQGSGAIVLDNVACVGTETSIFNCPHNGLNSHNCVHSEDVGVTCESATCEQNSARLVGGSTIFEGRVEVCNNGEWGTVCDDGWDVNDATVVCIQLGYGSALSAPQQAAFGQGTGDIVLDDLGCVGTEPNLFSCPHSGVDVHNCGHQEDASAVCSGITPICTDGSIRLVGGASSTQGRVEVCNNGDWGTVCDDSFTDVDAQVACRQLGFSSTGATAQCCAAYGQGSGAIVLDNVACVGTETSIFNCPHNGLNSHNCGHSEDVGVTCESATCEQNSARLVGGSTIFEGRVEVCNNGEWGTVCDDGWDVSDATVVCMQLGYGSASSAPQQAAFGQGTGQIVLDNLECVGTEPNLFDCPHNGINIHNCGHSEDASAVCSGITPPVCTDGAIQLVGGANSTQGRLEVCNNGQWGTVCDDSFGNTDAQVACRHLGFQVEGATAQCCAEYGQGTGVIVLDDVACTGSEASIFDCDNSGINIHNCGHSEDVGVTCIGPCTQGSARLVDGTNQYEGRVEVCYNGEWGTVCDDLWGTTDATVVCQELGYGPASSAPSQAAFGQGTGPILLDNVGCQGNEERLFDCPNNGVGNHNCGHHEDASAVCTETPPECTNGDVRLVGEANDTQGRVEVCNNDAWGTVCDDGFDNLDAQVICRQLGLSTGGATAQCCAAYGQGSGAIVLDNVACVGTETSIFNCPHNGINVHNCGHSEDVGVTCAAACEQGSIRLVGGISDMVGRVEVCNNGDWGTVCDDGFTDVDAQVACRQLGFSPTDATAQCCAAYGEGTGSIVLDNVACTGTETSIFNCPHNGINVHNCVHGEDVGIVCQALTGDCLDGDIRLVGGSTIYEGRVEVCVNGAWGTVCDDLWDVDDANVACRQLGADYGIASSAPCCGFYGEGTGDIFLDDLQCSGSETSLFDCTSTTDHNCAHSEDAGVVCTGPPLQCSNGDVRLMGASTTYQGRVEVCYNDAWGTVCDDFWDLNDGHVVCRQLGYGSALSAPQQAAFGQGTGAIVLDDVACTGSELRLFDCPNNGPLVHNCVHAEDASVTCAVCTNGDVQLVGGTTDYEGRVELCDNNAWGTVCDDLWDINDANVVCRQLGFGTATDAPCCATFGQGTGSILLDNVGCTGSEEAILNCPSNGVGIHNCGHHEDAGVRCQVCTNTDIRLVGGLTSMEGRVEVCFNNAWGTVCDNGWDTTDGGVACRQLGFGYASSATTGASFGEGTGSIVLEQLQCTGQEANLFECSTGIGTQDCVHSKDAGVICEAAPLCEEGQLRLQNGEYNTGRVELCNDGQWGTVCDDFWDLTDANVACRQLGFPSATLAQCCAVYGNGDGSILLDTVQCVGTESRLVDCPHNGINNHDCSHFEDAGLQCAHNVRLVGGNSNYEGRVEVYSNGTWGTVCDDAWDLTDAMVVCNQLGYGPALSAPSQAAFGQGTGPIVLDNLLCTGNESNLLDCPHNGINIHNCGHNEDASAICTGPIICTHGDVRLAGGSSESEGRVEVCSNGTWGTVCDDAWDVTDASVACRQLGYGAASSAPCCASYGQGFGDIILDNVGCDGTESSIIECPHNGINIHNCAHSEDAGAVCVVCVENDVRLVGGNSEFEGRVEICISEEWGTVCDDLWDLNDGHVVCRQLNFGPATSAPGQAFFGQGTGPIVLDDVGCTGTEERLIDCSNAGVNIHNCVHFEDSSVICSRPPVVCIEGDLRLVGGSNEFEGRVEICHDNQWGTICDDVWDNNDAMVVCRQLGYLGGIASGVATFGQGVDPIWLDNVNCIGTEQNLTDCPHNGFGVHNCAHSEDAGVTCEAVTTPPPFCIQGDIRLVGGTNERQGRVELCNDNEWGTVCDDFFGAEEATVACTQLGLNGVGATWQAFAAYGQGTGPIILDDLQCNGTETSLFDCSHGGINSHNCAHFEDVGVTCPLICIDGDVRLVDGTNNREGRVEICSNEVWGTICDDSWDNVDASVLCYQLGYGRQGIAYSMAFFGQGTGPILLDDLGCSGTETRLIECSHSGVGSHNCAHFEDAGVACNGQCTDGDVRLVGGSSQYEGRVELCMGGLWGTICDDFWDTPDAQVVCTQLGFTPIGAQAIQFAFFGQGTGDIYLDDVMCDGTESTLVDCPATSQHNCNHFEDSSVVCSPDEPPTCSSLTPPTNGNITYSPDTTAPYDYLTTGTYGCNTGYALFGGDNETTCNSTGGWTGAPPTCEPITCVALDPIFNGTITYGPDTTALFDYGTVATYSCIDGHYLEGDEIRTCTGVDDIIGVWTGVAPVCAAIMCPVLFNPENGYITYSEQYSPSFGFMEMATYACNVGFGLTGGDTVRTCMGEEGTLGDWDGTAPSCEAIMCPDIPGIVNGEVIYIIDVTAPHDFGTVATYVCDVGYATIGEDSRRVCTGDGSNLNGMWTGTAPTCEAYECAELSPLDNGAIIYSPDASSPFTFGTVAIHSCDPGYTLGGALVRTCLGFGSNTTGYWDSSPPQCIAIVCSDLTALINGYVTYAPDTTPPYDYQTTATYGCNDGFGLLGGDKTRQCVGSISGSDEWTGTAPTCTAITCPVLTPPDNGQVSYSTISTIYFVGTVATYSCDRGFTIVGDETSMCGGDGSSPNGVWSGTLPTCEVSTCTALIPPNNGQVTYSSPEPYSFGTVATFSCRSGQELVGNATRVCGDGSQWTGMTPSCMALFCPALNPITNGAIVYSPDTTSPYDIGTSATYSCDPGFNLGGDQVRNCNTNGTWSGAASVCTALVCPNLDSPSNGFVTFTQDGQTLTATYTCALSYGLSISGDAVRTCNSSSLWTGTPPTCEPITCSALSLPVNGLITYFVADPAPIPFGTEATYDCDTGFGLNGDETVVCEGDGSSPTGMWTGVIPTCEAITCDALSSVSNGDIAYSPDTNSPFDYGTNATYSCNDGYFLEGEDVLTCDGDGSSLMGDWDGLAPQCTAIICVNLVPPTNGMISYSRDVSSVVSFETMATYICDDGYGLTGGDSMRTCTAASVGGGEWSGTAPTCEAITCPELPSVTNGVIVFSVDTPAPYDHGTSARYDCDSGYGLNGIEAVLFCEGDGSSPTGAWSASPPTCEPINCITLSPLDNGQITYYPNANEPLAFGTVASYMCDEGFFLELGDQSRNCDGDGSNYIGIWDGVAPVCSEILCLTLVPPTNGAITYAPDMSTPFDYQSTATYTCSAGYTLTGGDSVRTCVGSSEGGGAWSGIAPKCEVTTCPALMEPINAMITYSSDTSENYAIGVTATYSCVDGFGRNGVDEVRTCGSDGEWTGTATSCGVITCPGLIIDNGYIEYTPDVMGTYEHGTTATYYCNPGFELQGNSMRVCDGDGSSTSGTFTGQAPTCVALTCSSLPLPANGVITYSPATPAPYAYLTTATYNCNPGYELSGEAVRTCVNSQWNGTAPTCRAITCPALTTPMNAMITYSSGTSENYAIGVTATYSCVDGFGRNGGDEVRTCGSDGEWTGMATSCGVITCSGLSIDNGYIEYTPDMMGTYEYGTTATYYCNPGFELQGNSMRVCDGDGSSTSGIFTGQAPTCVALVCSSLTQPTNGVIVYSDTTPPYAYLSTATYNCNPGYELSGEAVRTCVNSQWNGTAPTCRGPGAPTSISYELDGTDCTRVNLSWSEPLPMDQVGGISRYHVVVTQRSTGDQETRTTSELFIILSNLDCCQEYDFTVAAGNDFVLSDSSTAQSFRTRPDLTDIATIMVSIIADTSLRIGWTETDSTIMQHLPTDTYTVTLVPNCINNPPGLTTPQPQTVSYTEGHVIVSNLDPAVRYNVSVDALVCGSPVAVHQQTASTTPVNELPPSTILSVTRLETDPSQAIVTWNPSPNVVDIHIFADNEMGENTLVRSIPIDSTSGSSTAAITGLEICTPYSFTVNSATCAAEATSPSVTLKVADTTVFEFSFNLGSEDQCTSFIRLDITQYIKDFEDAMNSVLSMPSCGSFSVSCFQDTTIQCSRSDLSRVFVSTTLVGHGGGRTSSIQSRCLTSWLSTNPEVTIGDGQTSFVIGTVPSNTNTGGTFPTWVVAIIVIAVLALILVVIIVAAVLYRRLTRYKKFEFGNPSINDDESAHRHSIGIIENPLFSETDEEISSEAAKKEAEAASEGDEMKEDLSTVVNFDPPTPNNY